MRSNCRQHFVATIATSRNVIFLLCAAAFVLYTHAETIAQMDVSTPRPLAERQKITAEREVSGVVSNYPPAGGHYRKPGSTLNINRSRKQKS
jgi:hypothetical protein